LVDEEMGTSDHASIGRAGKTEAEKAATAAESEDERHDYVYLERPIRAPNA
jgi:hypothetical protein